MRGRVVGTVVVSCAVFSALGGPAAADPNPDSAAGICLGPPGETISLFTPKPRLLLTNVVPGQAVKELCAPGQQE